MENIKIEINIYIQDGGGYIIKDKYGNYKTPAIILMHDCMTKTTTVEALSEIIKFLKNESYAFKALK